MSPPDLDSQVVLRRLVAMGDLLSVLDDIDPSTSDRITVLALERILTRLVHLAGDINGHVVAVVAGRASGSVRESFLLAADAGIIPADLAHDLLPSAAMRDVLIHHSEDVDPSRVMAAAPVANAKVSTVRRYLEAVGGEMAIEFVLGDQRVQVA